jgi:hypothetical protein
VRILSTWATAILLIAMAAAGCGGSSSGTTAASTAAPAATTAPPATTADARERLGAALRMLQAGSYRATLQTRQTFDATDAPAAVQRQVQGVALSTRGTTAVESTRRSSGTMQLPLGPTTVGRMRFVLHDGAMFISRDGRDWRRASGELASALEGSLTQASQDLAAHLTGVRAAGRTTFAGVAAERYLGAIDPAFVIETVGSVFSRLGLDPDLLGVEDADGSFIVRASDGALLAQEANQTVSLDLSKLPGGLDGTILARGVSEVRYTDHGEPIRVVRPTASGTLSTAVELGAFLLDQP